MDSAEATVKVHVKAILRKIRVHNRTQAAIWGMNNGCLSEMAGAMAPPLSPRMAKRLPSVMPPISGIDDIGDTGCSTVIEQTSHAEAARIDRFIRNDAVRAEAAGRPRK